MEPLDYDERVRKLADLGRRCGLVTTHGTTVMVKGTRYDLPRLCACCGGTEGLRTVERGLVANVGIPAGDPVRAVSLVARFPLCLRCRLDLQQLRPIAAEAERLARKAQPLTWVQWGLIGASACLSLVLIPLGLWQATLMVLGAGATGCLLMQVGIALSRLHDEKRLVAKVRNASPRGWRLPALVRYPGTTFRWRASGDPGAPKLCQVWTGLVCYDGRFAEAMAACNRDILAEGPLDTVGAG